MPQLILVLLAGAGLWAGYRWVRKEQGRVKDQLRAAEAELRKREENAIPKLRRNPETGVYEPAGKE